MLAQLKQVNCQFAVVKEPAWRPTIVRNDLWAQTATPQADWAKANPEKMMTYLMVAQDDFAGLDEILG